MKQIYEVRLAPDWTAKDYANEQEALDAVERAGSGRITTFVRDFDGRDRSCALRVFDGAWRSVDISQ